MNKKQLAILFVLLVLAGTAVYMLKDSFAAQPIQIACLIRPAQPGRRPQSSRMAAPSGKPGYNVTFAFNHKITLTAVKVFPLQEVLTNKYPHAIWNLTSTSKVAPTKTSKVAPTKSIVYGEWIHGLQPTVKGATADPLEPGGSYRLVIEAGEMKAEQDFSIPR